MSDEDINDIIRVLNEATTILTGMPSPDMDVSEWNQTPIGKAVNKIASAIELLEELDT